MFRFFKNLINTLIIILAVFGAFCLYKQDFLQNCCTQYSNLFSTDKEKIETEIGDFSNINKEFNIDKAVKVVGYKTIVAKHPSSGQKMIIVDSGKKALLTADDITSDKIKEKLNDLSKKVKHVNLKVDNIEIIEKGYMTTYGHRVPYAKFKAKVSNIPKTDICGIVSAVDSDKNNQKLILSLNDSKHYSQLITSEFYKNVNESKIQK